MLLISSTSSVHPRLYALCSYSCACEPISASATTHLQLVATSLSLPGAGTVYSDISRCAESSTLQ
jgi:hypothetical protein